MSLIHHPIVAKIRHFKPPIIVDEPLFTMVVLSAPLLKHLDLRNTFVTGQFLFPKISQTKIEQVDIENSKVMDFTLIDSALQQVAHQPTRRLVFAFKKYPFRSITAGADKAVDVEFCNESKDNVEIFWVDYNGVEVMYGTLTPNTSYIQPTYLTHPWIIRRNGEAILYTIGVPSRQRKVIVTDDTGTKSKLVDLPIYIDTGNDDQPDIENDEPDMKESFTNNDDREDGERSANLEDKRKCDLM
eukprot:TRINITY_DN8950_c0_g1_i2.p1 TRINITY_DN8950_c0_g1~~TRINITY_DN8950_c0_g1_i2.p1  ORF type:complete len:243 (-),score=36.43 TRINITY_DN8950_c0_g1_i2:78-806(-)